MYLDNYIRMWHEISSHHYSWFFVTCLLKKKLGTILTLRHTHTQNHKHKKGKINSESRNLSIVTTLSLVIFLLLKRAWVDFRRCDWFGQVHTRTRSVGTPHWV